MRQINTIVIHHSVTDPNNKDIWAESIPSKDFRPGYYIDGKEYAGNYHYMIYQDGEVKHPVNDDWYTYHCGVYNTNLTSLAVSFIGNFDENEPSQLSLATAKQVIEEIKSRYNISNIYLHRDLYQTACPGQFITIDKIMEVDIMNVFDTPIVWSQEMVDYVYWRILRRPPEKGCPYVGSKISPRQFIGELGDSKEHTDYYNDAMKWRGTSHTGVESQYELITEKLYRLKK